MQPGQLRALFLAVHKDLRSESPKVAFITDSLGPYESDVLTQLFIQ